MNAMKLTDLNEPPSRMLLQRTLPPCLPAFLSIFTELPYCVSNWHADNFDIAIGVNRKYQIEIQTIIIRIL